jgi:hypothetical protein
VKAATTYGLAQLNLAWMSGRWPLAGGPATCCAWTWIAMVVIRGGPAALAAVEPRAYHTRRPRQRVHAWR